MNATAALDLRRAFVELLINFFTFSRVIRPNFFNCAGKVYEMTGLMDFSLSENSSGVDILSAFKGFDSNFRVFYRFFLVQQNFISVKKNYALKNGPQILKLAWGRRVSHFELVPFP